MAAVPLSLVHSIPKEVSPFASEELRTFLPGLPRGAITEVVGGRSSGRTAFVHSLLSEATARGEVCAVIDPANAFDPATAARAGSDLRRLLWVQGNGRLDSSIKAADLVIHSSGFGVVVLDFCEQSPRVLAQIPLSYWYRFRRAVEHTSTMLIVMGNQTLAKSCATLQLGTEKRRALWTGRRPFQLLSGTEFEMSSWKPSRAGSTILTAQAMR